MAHTGNLYEAVAIARGQLPAPISEADRCDHCGGSGLSPNNPLVGCGACKARNRKKTEAGLGGGKAGVQVAQGRLYRKATAKAKKGDRQGMRDTWKQIKHKKKARRARMAKDVEEDTNTSSGSYDWFVPDEDKVNRLVGLVRDKLNGTATVTTFQRGQVAGYKVSASGNFSSTDMAQLAHTMGGVERLPQPEREDQEGS
jgi:hypothetical protein